MAQELAQLKQRGDSNGSARADVIDVRHAQISGSGKAKVALVEFTDFECPFCGRFAKEVEPSLEKDYVDSGKIRRIFMDYPLIVKHPASMQAHVAGRCVAAQQKFWFVERNLFGPPSAHTPAAIEQLVAASGVEISAFRACAAGRLAIKAVDESVAEAKRLRIAVTPTFFVGTLSDDGYVTATRALRGSPPYNQLRKILDEFLTDLRLP